MLRIGISIDWDILVEEFIGDLNFYYGLEEDGYVVIWVGVMEVYID